MSPRTIRLMKEARVLFAPWCAVVILCALPLIHVSHGFLHRFYVSLSDISLVSASLGIPMLATLSLGYEFQQRTLSLLLTQPVSRMVIWGEKLSVTFVAVLSAALVLGYSWPSGPEQDPKLWAFIGVYLLAMVPSATFWTLFARSTIGGFLLNGLFPYTVILVYREEIFGPSTSPARSTTALWTAAFAALCYAGLMLWLGSRKLARFQVGGGMAGDDLLMAGSSVIPEALAGGFRCRPTGAVLNLIRKELRLLRPVWLISFVILVYLTCLTLFRFLFLRESAAPSPEGVQLFLYIPVLFTPVLAKHTKHLSLVDVLSIGIDRIQRNFEPMKKQVEARRTRQLSDEAAKLIIYRAFIEGELEVPKHLARVVHGRYFDPQHEEFAPRTLWSLSNTFTSAFKELEAIPQFRATAKLGAFLEGVHAA